MFSTYVNVSLFTPVRVRIILLGRTQLTRFYRKIPGRSRLIPQQGKI